MDFTHDPLVNHVIERSVIDSDSDSDSDNDNDSDSDSQSEEIQVEYEEIKNVTSDLTKENNSIVVEEVEEVEEMEETKVIDLDNTVHLSIEEVKQDEPLEITIQLAETETNYSKMSMKQLKEVLSSKGIKAKNNMKKDELLELITNEIKA
jgi:hypothetical protein